MPATDRVDFDALACLQFADMLADRLHGRGSSEPIELSRRHARGLTEYVLVPSAMREHGMQDLYDALLRLRGDSV